jgi:hypothetical protein
VAALVLLATILSGTGTGQQNTVVAKEMTLVATVERINLRTRVLTVKNEDGAVQDVLVDPAVKNLSDLRVGDAITVRYVESIVVRVRPGARLGTEKDTTATARRGEGGANVEQQSQAVVTIDHIDADRQVVTYRTADGQKIVRLVEHKALLDGLRAGDRVEVTFTRERAVSIERRPR